MIYLFEIDKQKKAYELTFTIENKLRVSMHNIMVAKKGLNYFTTSTLPGFEYNINGQQKEVDVIKYAKQRRGKEKHYNMVLGYEYPDLWYLDFPILLAIIDVYWDNYCKNIFVVSAIRNKTEILRRMSGIVHIRNAVAHHRYVSAIDLNDLESAMQVLDSYINKNYLYNFDDLVLNSFENQIKQLIETCDQIKVKIEKGLIIRESNIELLKSTFSAVSSMTQTTQGITKLEALIALIKKYNKLPRKPGRGEEIAIFKKSNRLGNRLDFIMNLVGGLK